MLQTSIEKSKIGVEISLRYNFSLTANSYSIIIGNFNPPFWKKIIYISSYTLAPPKLTTNKVTMSKYKIYIIFLKERVDQCPKLHVERKSSFQCSVIKKKENNFFIQMFVKKKLY